MRIQASFSLHTYISYILKCSCPFSPTMLTIFSLVLVSSNLTMMCFCVVFFVFMLLRLFWASQICELIFFFQFSKMLRHNFFKYFLCSLFSLLSLRDFNYTYVIVFDVVLQFSDTLFLTFLFSLNFIYFFSLYGSVWINLSSSSLLIFSSTLSSLLSPSNKFFISVLEFSFYSFVEFHILCWNSNLFTHFAQCF